MISMCRSPSLIPFSVVIPYSASFKVYLLLQDVGIALALSSTLPISTKLVAKAVTSSPDMELIMNIHTRERIFVGRVPKTLEESFKTTLLMLGASPVTFAKTARVSNLKISKSGPKGLNSNSPVTDMLRGHYGGNGNTQKSFDTVENLLEEQHTITTTSVAVQSLSRIQSLVRQQWVKSQFR